MALLGRPRQMARDPDSCRLEPAAMSPAGTEARRVHPGFERRTAAMSVGSMHVPAREWGLDERGLNHVANIHWNLPGPALEEQIILRREGMLAHLGPIVVRTGNHTGRSPNDKFLVDEPSVHDEIWWGLINKPFAPTQSERLYARVQAYLQDKDVFVQDCYAGADPRYRIPIRVITEMAWHSLFSRNMFIRELDPDRLRAHKPEFTVIGTPRFHAVPELDGTHSDAFIIVNFPKRLVLIGGTQYAGEIKKSVFTIMHYLLPKEHVLSMHCSANYGKDRNDVALFFGLSGTGKTTLSTSPDRTLIGDDEHGWSDDGVFNFEGGCYAKVLRISAQSEPKIYETTRKFGTILENVSIDPATRRLDLDDASLTENTRAAYPISHIPHADRGGVGGHPKNIFFLTYDAFGVLPPIARLTPQQAMYHFVSGYTSKVAGTEAGVTEPKAVFSACFGAPFLPRHPKVYAELLAEQMKAHGADCWLVNTGMTGGPYGVGTRMPISLTRGLIDAALSGALAQAPLRDDPNFGVRVPTTCSGVDPKVLDPRGTWSDPAAYDAK